MRKQKMTMKINEEKREKELKAEKARKGGSEFVQKLKEKQKKYEDMLYEKKLKEKKKQKLKNKNNYSLKRKKKILSLTKLI